MGRPKLKQTASDAIKQRLIESTRKRIKAEGLSGVTIRNIAQDASLNSAVLYKYFENLDELLLFACVDTLRDYTAALLEAEASTEAFTPRERYMTSWTLFCRHAFSNPESIRHLFFSAQSARLKPVIQEYYRLFPGEFGDMPQCLQQMLLEADLSCRNLAVLQPVLEGKIPPHELVLRNELTIAAFYMLLTQRIQFPDQYPAERQQVRMLEACAALLRPFAE